VRIVVIVNGISRKKKRFYHRILPALIQKFSVEVVETKYSNHATQLAKEAALNQCDVILSAGGDGTLNQVLNGMRLANSPREPVLGIIPLGSGNDFAAMMKISGEADQLIALLQSDKTRMIDVGKVSYTTKQGGSEEKYFINACSLGMGPATVLRLEKLPRWLGTSFRYYASVLNTFFTHPTERFEVHTPDWNWKGSARVIAIANGQSFGNKIYIAPDGQPDDGLFSVFIATDMPLLRFLRILQEVKSKKIVNDSRVIYYTANELKINSPEPAWLETEGELAGLLPVRIELLKGRIKFLG